LLAFACERAVRLFPWSRVEEIEDRPTRLRMEYSLEHAKVVATVCVTIGALGVAIMSGGLLVLLGEAGPQESAPVHGWIRLLVLLLAATGTAWVGPGLVAHYAPEPIVGFWVPLVGRLVTAGLTRDSGETAAGGDSREVPEEEEEDAEGEAREVYRSLLRLSTVTASEIMTPRIHMVFVRDSATIAEVLEAAERSGYSRLPVFHESRDQIVGVVYVKDLLRRLDDPNWKTAPMRDVVRKPLFVPETKKVDELLEEFQRSKVHLGIVLDEYGGTAGLITIEDIIEELLGEIRDEHDPDEARRVHPVSGNAFELDATVRVEEVNEGLDVNLPEDEDFDTIGGYVTFALGRLPVAGEKLERDGVRMTVLDADQRRVKRVRLELPEERAWRGEL